MWGRFYWGSKGGDLGIVVVFAWPSSEEKQLKPYIDLYSSLGWNSLVCHADFLTSFFPEKATALADGVLKELVKELSIRSLPVIFLAFSGGPNGCMYKVLQLIGRKCEGQLTLDEYQLVRDCLCGQIYDSGPVDFTSDLATQFLVHPSGLKLSQPPRVLSWMVKGFASGLDTLFIDRFESQRVEYWQTLYSSANVGPILIFCSEDDDFAPYRVVRDFVQRLQDLGAMVNVVKWGSSPHVGHYKHHPGEYKAAVTELLRDATIIYSERRHHVNNDSAGIGDPCNKIPESICNLHKAAVNSNESLTRIGIDPSDHFFLPSSMEYHENHDEPKGEPFQQVLTAHGVLGQILFDVCVPKNIEGWDIKPTTSSNRRQTFTSARQDGSFNPIKCIWRSRL
ncbi:uncharacterized protein [Typha latifolia]|uniref:uncharacterized protein isoform X1 n=1 Tax=Typha latifolia TaxID=4733 RepID=UPI003C2CDAC0